MSASSRSRPVEPSYPFAERPNSLSVNDSSAKYSDAGGKIELRLERPAASQDRARIEVRDEGLGIVPDKLDAIFDLFVPADALQDRLRGGPGIGLALVRSSVELPLTPNAAFG